MWNGAMFRKLTQNRQGRITRVQDLLCVPGTTNAGPYVIYICFIESNIHFVFVQLSMGDNWSIATLGSKIRFLSVLDTFSPIPSSNVDFSNSSTAQTTVPTQHWIGAAGGVRELTLDANIIEQMLKYRKACFPKVSQLLLSLIVWRLLVQIVAISFIYPSSSKFFFTKATKCVAQCDSWLKKKWKVFFLAHRNSHTKTNLVYAINKWIHI